MRRPLAAITVKDLTNQAKGRLNGLVDRVLPKGAFTREELPVRVRELVAARMG